MVALDSDIHINILMEDSGVESYRATLGHKAQHSFVNDNAFYCNVYHPRYGETKGVCAKKDIKKHAEIITNYGYAVKSEEYSIPKW